MKSYKNQTGDKQIYLWTRGLRQASIALISLVICNMFNEMSYLKLHEIINREYPELEVFTDLLYTTKREHICQDDRQILDLFTSSNGNIPRLSNVSCLCYHVIGRYNSGGR